VADRFAGDPIVELAGASYWDWLRPPPYAYLASPGGLLCDTDELCREIGALLPNLQDAWRQSFETKTLPGILKQIHDAEIIYRARQPERNFACDGTMLPGAAGKLGWAHSDENPTINNYIRVKYYNIRLDCPNVIHPRSFGITASSNDGYIHAPLLSMDETGKLVVVPSPSTGPNTH
jgi:hypothetical protein